jgi:hypothetical protein
MMMVLAKVCRRNTGGSVVFNYNDSKLGGGRGEQRRAVTAKKFVNIYSPPQQPEPARPSASSMIRRMVRAHRPHWTLQPRQLKTWPAVRGAASSLASAARTSRSEKTLQEHTIIAGGPAVVGINCNYPVFRRRKK